MGTLLISEALSKSNKILWEDYPSWVTRSVRILYIWKTVFFYLKTLQKKNTLCSTTQSFSSSASVIQRKLNRSKVDYFSLPQKSNLDRKQGCYKYGYRFKLLPPTDFLYHDDERNNSYPGKVADSFVWWVFFFRLDWIPGTFCGGIFEDWKRILMGILHFALSM